MIGKLDVLICAYNEAQTIAALLDSLTVQSITKDTFRVLFIDNGSTDESKTILDSYEDRLDILYAYEPRLGKSYALNTGYGLASSEYVAQIDADCRAESHWLENILKVIEEEKPDAIGGPYFPYFSSPKPVWYKDEYNQHFRGNERKIISEGYLDGANSVWRRKLVLDLGGYSEKIMITGADVAGGEDTELVVRARQKCPDVKIIYDPFIVVYHLTKKKYLSVLKSLSRSYELGRRARHIFNKSGLSSGSLSIVVLIIRKLLMIAVHLFNCLLFRDRRKYPHYQNYLLEVVAPSIHTLGNLISEFQFSLPRTKL